MHHKQKTLTIMATRIKKADSFEKHNHQGDCMTYTINGKTYEVYGEFYYNKEKCRYEHTHIGKRGGEMLITWQD